MSPVAVSASPVALPKPSVGSDDWIRSQLYAQNAELAVRNQTLKLQHDIALVTLKTLETRGMAQEIARMLVRAFHVPLVAIGVVGKTGRTFSWESLACYDPKAKLCFQADQQTTSFSLQKNADISHCLTHHRPFVVSHIASCFESVLPAVAVEEYALKTHMQSLYLHPLVSHEKSVGVFAMGLLGGKDSLTRFQKDALDGLSNLITVALEKAETYTSLRETTHQLRVANSQLKEMDQLKTEFLSIATHQLRTPLAVVKGYADTLPMVGKLNPAQKGLVSQMRTSADQLIVLVNHFLNVSRIETGRVVLNCKVMDIRPILTQVVEFLRPKADEKHLDLEIHLPDKEASFFVDEEKLKEVFMNLVDNAIKYTEKGRVSVTCTYEKDVCRIGVKDSGFGLTPEDKRKLFQKFAVGSASKHVKTTSGLGLFVAKKLLTAMHGTIDAHSEGIGKGSEFVVQLPYHKP